MSQTRGPLGSETPPRGIEPRPQTSTLRWLLLLLLGVGVAASFYFSYRWNREAQKEISSVRQQMGEISEKTAAALSRAEAAENSARQASIARQEAESARELAEAETRQAREQAQDASQRADVAHQEKEQALAEARRIRNEREEELNRLQEALGRIAETRRTAIGLVMNLDSNAVQFEFDKADLLPQNRELLSRIAGILLTSKGYRLTVYGHTDDIGSEAYNEELSARRAQAVRNYLVEAGIDSEIIDTKAYGKKSPLVEAKTAEARARNRRVEISIVDTVLHFGQKSN
ncbi:MAG: OmpA family protein [Acidobacteriota bacterium]